MRSLYKLTWIKATHSRGFDSIHRFGRFMIFDLNSKNY